ncbi:MAG: type I restriction enzyme endonuclease domain-containing protein [Sulfuriferula sp.]
MDWAVRESVRASLRLMVKRILRKYKYRLLNKGK